MKLRTMALELGMLGVNSNPQEYTRAGMSTQHGQQVIMIPPHATSIPGRRDLYSTELHEPGPKAGDGRSRR